MCLDVILFYNLHNHLNLNPLGTAFKIGLTTDA